MSTGMTRRMARSALAVAAVATLSACPTKAPEPRPCCDQPEIPSGTVKFKVVADEASGPADGLKVVIRAGLTQPGKRDQVYAPLRILYRHAMKRPVLEPIHVEAWLYATESDAEAGGDAKVIAKLIKEQSDVAPRCENRVKYDLAEQVERAFIWSTQGEQVLKEDLNDTCHIAEKKKVVRFDETFTHKTTYKIDQANGAVEITYHYLDMGKDEYVAGLKLNSALAAWAEFMTSMFSKVDGLRALTFAGMHEGAPAIRISVSRDQYDNLLARLQEQIAAHAAITFQNLGMGTMNEKKAFKDQESFKAKTYKAALDKLPKEQVTISPKLKWFK